MIKNLHPAIKNPETYPSILLKSVNNIVQDFSKSYSADIKKGCERHFCVLPAMKLTKYLKSKGFPKSKTVKGTFTVDDPRPLTVSDFTDEERALAKQQGFYLGDKDNAWRFAVKNNLVDELKNIPHYWTQIGDLIIDFTGEEQFVKTGMAKSFDISKYKKPIKETILTEVGDTKYNWQWQNQNSEIQFATFKTETGEEISVEFVYDLDNHIPELRNGIGVSFSRDGRSDETGQGDAIKIFSTVMDIITDYIKTEHPEKIFAAAYKPSISGSEPENDVEVPRSNKRAVIYKKGFNLLANKLGYHISLIDQGYQEIFILTKKNIKETILTEIGDSSYTYIWNKTNEDEWAATFREDSGDLVRVNILGDGASNDWILEFRRKNRYDITGGGNAFKIFSTVIKILKEFVKNVKPDSITVNVEKGETYEESRVKLYANGLSKIANDINYSFAKSENDESVAFILKNKNNSANESIITELGETSYPYKVSHNTIELFSAEFTTNENVKVEFFSKLMHDETTWDTAFSANGSIGLTGGGDQYRILSTILKLMNLFILTKNPKIITFTSDKIKDISNGKRKTARTNVYKKAMNIISAKHGYTVEINPLPYMDKFVLTKTNSLTEEINSKEITSSLYAKIMNYADRINAADTPNKILSVIRQITKKQALEMSKKHISDIDYSSWIFEFKLHDGAQHKGAVAFNEHEFGLLQIYLSKPLIKKYLTDLKIPEKKDDIFANFWYDLTRLVSHEMLHLEQWLRSKGKQANRKTMLGKLKSERGSVKTDTPEDFKFYLSDKLEISAYALNAVQELIHNNIDISKLYREYILKNNAGIRDFIRSKSTSYNSYYVYFGQNKNDGKDQSVWNLFLKKFTYHLELRVK